MPSDFLLPLFALTLLANAVLVAVAIRGLRRGRPDPNRSIAGEPLSIAGEPLSVAAVQTAGELHADAPGSSPDRPLTDELRRAIASRRATLEVRAAPTAALAAAPVTAEVQASGEASPAEASTQEPAPSEPSAPEPSAPERSAPEPSALEPGRAQVAGVRRRRSPTTANRPSPMAAGDRARPAERARGGRRRFALPPMDDDHEKVSRSIETFLGGGEPADEPPARSDPAAAGATTVAAIAVDGLPPRPRRSKTNRAGAEEEAVSSALAMVERTIRGAARGSDVVSAVGRGRYRIVLPGTGELAARSYLRRIRATVEPLLESAEHPLRLAVATVTVLDEPIAGAVRRADRRLSAALAALKAPDAVEGEAGQATTDTGELDAEPKPRAAAD